MLFTQVYTPQEVLRYVLWWGREQYGLLKRKSMKITQIIAREIYDSRGWPTIQCDIALDDDTIVSASVPAGLSRSRYEARERRDGGKRLWGMGVKKAIETIHSIIAPELVGQEPHALDMDFKMIDIDGTPDKSYLGANAMLAVSMALYRAHAHAEGVELYELIAYICDAESVTLPFPLLNVINGGLHADTGLGIQEFMIVPVAAENFRSSLELSVTVFHELKNVLKKHGKSTAVGDEGGFAPHFKNYFEALDILMEVLDKVDTADGGKCVIGLDVAASQLYDKTRGIYLWDGRRVSSADLIAEYEALVDQYPIYSIEDGLDEDDWNGWQQLTARLEDKAQIVADDIFATNTYRIEQGIKDHIATGVIIKPNQVGTITETLQAIQLSKENELNCIVSHRSGETEDTFIADLAVGASVGQIKAGGCSRSERLAKYNRLLEIEDTLMGAE